MKIKCNNCNEILTDEIHSYQVCSCGKVAFDTSDVKLYRILGNRNDYNILET